MAATDTAEQSKFADDSKGWAARWQFEMDAAREKLKKWQDQGEKIIKRFLDERDGSLGKNDTRWNFFTANIQTQRALLYGKTPQVSVDRRFNDASDHTARIAAEMLERLLNTDIERDGDSYAAALELALSDRLLPGLGLARVRYVADFEAAKDEESDEALLDEEGEPVETKKPGSEDVETDYLHWKDIAWSPARTWHEVRWLAFRAQMTRKQLVERFGEDLGKRVPLNSKQDKTSIDADKANPWGRAEVWEIWDKEHREVFWWVEGFGEILDRKPDPLELDGFFPCPRPMFANVTTSGLVPRPDFVLAQDIYDEIDFVCTRITTLERAIKVVGVYDKTAVGVSRLLKEGVDNDLIAVENWAAFAEKGGIEGVISWLPVDKVVAALGALRDYRTELVNALFQITGMSDIMRGQSSDVGVTATEQSIKAKFASVRMQALQDEFARFASDLQRLKAEIIAKHFDVQTILERSNAAYTFDAAQQGLQQQAAQLIKDKFASYRVQVKPEAVSMTDFAALKAERTDFLQALSGFIQVAPAMVQAAPGSLPYLLQLLQWTISGLKGASSAEAILDQAISASQQAAAQQAQQPQMQQPDPKALAQQQQAQLKMQQQREKIQGDLMRIQAETQANAQQQEDQAKWNIYEQAAKERIKQGGVGMPTPIGPGAPGGVL